MRVALVLCALVAAAASWLVQRAPVWASHGVEQKLRQLDPGAEVGPLRMDGEQIVLRDLLVEEGLPLDARVALRELRVAPDALAVLRRGDSLIGAVELRGGEVAVSRSALRALLRSRQREEPRGGEAVGASGPAPGARGALRDAFARIADGEAQLQARDLRLGWRDEPGAEPLVLETLSLRVEDATSGRHLRGRGRLEAGGELRFDLRLASDAASAEGSLELEGLPATFLADWIDPRLGAVGGDEARLGVALSKLRAGADAVHADFALNATGLELLHPALHDEAIPVPPLDARGHAQWSEGRLRVERGRARVRDVALRFAGSFEPAEAARVGLQLWLPETPCARALDAIPATLRGPFRAAAPRGAISGSLALLADPGAPKESTLEIDADERCQLDAPPLGAELARLRAPFDHEVRGHDGALLHRFRTGPGHPHWTPLERVSPFLVHAVLAHEDAAFLSHQGFAPWAIETALQRNLEAGRFAYGASTISMQLSKNLFLQRDKTLSRKLQEILLTWWIESRLEKREILALYLNVIEYGPGIFGIGEATRHYFGLEPAELSPAQAAFLAALLPAPRTYHASCARGHLSDFMRREMEVLLEHMHRRDRIDGAALAHARAEIDDFRFRPHGGPPLETRRIAGEAGPLPFATASVPRAPEVERWCPWCPT